MSKLSDIITDYRCEINTQGRPVFYYKNNVIKGDKIHFKMIKKLSCNGEPLLLSSKYPIYLDLLPRELKILLLYYLTRFDLLTVVRPNQNGNSLLGNIVDSRFWQNKLFIDFDSDLREHINSAKTSEDKKRAEETYAREMSYLTSLKNKSDWRNYYLIFTYASDFGISIDSDTVTEFADASALIANPELIDAYLSLSYGKYFLVHYITSNKANIYIIQHYPIYRKYLALQLLLHKPSELLKLAKNNPDLKVSELAEAAVEIKLNNIVSGRPIVEFNERLGNTISNK